MFAAGGAAAVSACSYCWSACTGCFAACTSMVSCVRCCSGSWCASDDDKSTCTPGKVGSAMIVLNAMILSLILQYGVGRWIDVSFWTDGAACDRRACLAQQGVFRIALAEVCFFGAMAIGSRLSKQFHNALWPIKFGLVYVPLVVGLLFAPAPVIDGFVWAARAFAAVFVVLQMIVIVDLSYAVNDWFVAQSNADYNAVAAYARRDASDSEGLFGMMSDACAGLDESLTTLLSIALFLFALALAGTVLLFIYYTSCATNTAFVAMTLVLCVAATLTQLLLKDGNGNLLVSAAVSAYAVFVAYTAVSRDPNEKCNPFLRDHDFLGVVCGLVLALLSLAWTAHSSTAAVADVFGGGGDDSSNSNNNLSQDLVSNDHVRSNSMKERDDDDDDEETGARSKSVIPPAPIECLDGGDPESIRLNVVLALVACYIACSLTNWGTWETTGGGGLSAPLAGRVSSWLNIAAQWVMMLLYFWTLVAPLLFPDREFG